MRYTDNTCKPETNVIIDLKRVENIGAMPITLAEAKTQLRVDFTDDDTEITALIPKAIRFIENYCNISIIYQRLQLVAMLVDEYSLPYGPVVGIESVMQAVATQGSGPVGYETSTANWQTDGDLFNAASTYRQKIVYTAGGTLKEDLKQVCLEVITFLYENRGKDVKQDDMLPLLVKAQNYQVKLWI